MNTASSIDREIWIDWGKTICIFLMVVGHMFYPTKGTLDYEIKNFIYSFHMPVFFYLSGYLFKNPNGRFPAFLLRSTKSLLIPYFFFNVISLLGLIPFFLKDDIHKGIFETLIGGGHSFAGATWFLLSLFWIRLISFYVVKNICFLRFSIPISILLAYFCPQNLWWGLGAAFMAYPFFIIGYCHKLTKNIFPQLETLLNSVFLVVLSFGALVFINHYNMRVDIYMLNFGEIPILYYLESFIGVFCIISFSKLVGNPLSIVRKISNGTIVIMGTHIVISYYVKNMLMMIGLQSIISNTFKSAFMLAIIILPFSILMIDIMQRYFSVFIGGRK